MHSRSSLGLVVACLGIVLACTTCANAQNKAKSGESALAEPGKLRSQLRAFHKHMRWEAFDQAASMVSESHRQTFLGRYREHGGDYDVVHIRIKRVEPRDDGTAEVEVEQKWYVEPAMNVEKERFIEIWAQTSQGWRLEERLRKSKWRERRGR